MMDEDKLVQILSRPTKKEMLLLMENTSWYECINLLHRNHWTEQELGIMKVGNKIVKVVWCE